MSNVLQFPKNKIHSPHFKTPDIDITQNKEYADRLLRIRASLEKINSLMDELKQSRNKDVDNN